MLCGLLPCPSAASVTWREVKARVATSGLCFYRPSTVGHSQVLQIWTVVEVAHEWGRASHAWHERLINARNCQAHELIVKLSPCMCSCIGYPSWRNGWHMWYLVLSGEELATWAFWNLAVSLVTSPAICHDKLVNQQAKTLPKPPVNGKWMCM